MAFASFLHKLRDKLLRYLLGQNTYRLVKEINKFSSWYMLNRYAPESKYPELLCDWYLEQTGERLDLKNPLTYNEKIQWLKLYDTTPLKTRLSDKYLVREWIKQKIGEKYLVPILGVWDNFNQINFDLLPDQFVLKANHGCGWIIIVRDKTKFNREEAKIKFDKWLNINFAYYFGLELQYRDIEPKIIAEQYLEDESGGLSDYKYYCFEGKPYSVEYFIDRFERGGYKAIMYDLDWNQTDWTVDAHHEAGNSIAKPDNLQEMNSIAEILCAGFHHVRVDFYLVKDRIYFGEMTFTSANGLEHFEPEEWNRKLGDMIKLPIVN
ncbi:MAG: hypothetical protein FWG99_03845 [Treponema sp.]|nr:hypothetical protein [Treponema sp.]